MISKLPEALNFDRLFLQTQPVHLQLAAGSPRSLDDATIYNLV